MAGAGYMGPPMEELVEIGYSVVPEARGRGFATEIVRGPGDACAGRWTACSG